MLESDKNNTGCINRVPLFKMKAEAQLKYFCSCLHQLEKKDQSQSFKE